MPKLNPLHKPGGTGLGLWQLLLMFLRHAPGSICGFRDMTRDYCCRDICFMGLKA